MKVRISDIPQAGREISFNLDVEKLNNRVHVVNSKEGGKSPSEPDVSFVNNLPANLTLNLNGSTLLVQGEAIGEYNSVCSRCADEMLRKLEIPIQMVLEPVTGKTKKALGEEDVNFGFYEGDELDCDELVAEQVIITLPFIEVCKENCAGLCPQCGTNKNTKECNCAPDDEPADERLAVLRQLKLH